MPLITWKDSFSVGIGTVDRQHRVLVDLINRLHDAMGHAQGQAVLAGFMATC